MRKNLCIIAEIEINDMSRDLSKNACLERGE